MEVIQSPLLTCDRIPGHTSRPASHCLKRHPKVKHRPPEGERESSTKTIHSSFKLGLRNLTPSSEFTPNPTNYDQLYLPTLCPSPPHFHPTPPHPPRTVRGRYARREAWAWSKPCGSSWPPSACRARRRYRAERTRGGRWDRTRGEVVGARSEGVGGGGGGDGSHNFLNKLMVV